MFTVAAQIVQGCWITFAVVWLVAAFARKRSVYREPVSQRLRYALVLAAGYLLLAKGYKLSRPLNLRIIPASDAVAIFAAILCVAGLLFCFWARFTLGRNWSGTVTLKEGHELILTGPYRLVRHPIYTGLMTMIVATMILVGHVAGIIGALIVFAGFWMKASYEEAVMVQQFGEEYVAYRRRVKGIVPYLV
jgi:protein-S-isoprenylcysteine O-methyltransferase Ste14